MAATIRLMRFGKKNFPTYRIVVIDKRKKAKGSYIEKIGTYNPINETDSINIDKERFQYWIKNGAETSDGLKKLLKHKIDLK